MNINEFRASSIKTLDDFVNVWLAKNATNPKDWPILMTEGEWFEQFLAYQTSEA